MQGHLKTQQDTQKLPIIFGHVHKIAKSNNLLHQVCQSVRPSIRIEQPGPQFTNICEM